MKDKIIDWFGLSERREDIPDDENKIDLLLDLLYISSNMILRFNNWIREIIS